VEPLAELLVMLLVEQLVMELGELKDSMMVFGKVEM